MPRQENHCKMGIELNRFIPKVNVMSVATVKIQLDEDAAQIYARSSKEKREKCNGQELVEPQSAQRTQRIKEKNFAPFASFAVKFCSRNS